MRTLLRRSFALFLSAIALGVALLFAALLLAAPARAQQEVSGTIESDQTWTTSDTPYILTGNVKVAEGATLTVEPGVEVVLPLFDDLVVEGTLIADAAPGDSIRFRRPADYNGSAGQLTFRPSSTASVLDHVVVKGLRGSLNGGGALNIEGTSGVELTNSAVTGSEDSGLYLTDSAQPTIRSNVFQNNPIGIRLSGWPAPDLGTSSDYGQNVFRGSAEYAVRNETGETVQAIGNYWNTTSASVIDSRIYDDDEDSGSGPVLFEPFLDEPPGNDGGSELEITGVSPDPVTGSDELQTFTISGSGFEEGDSVTLRDLDAGETFPDREISSLTSTEIVLNPTFGTEPAMWSVEVISPDNESSGEYEFEVVAPDGGETPAPPTGLAAAPGDGTVSLSWDASAASDLAEYRLYRGTSPQPTTQIATIAEGNTTYDDTEVSNGTTYYYRLTAVDDDGNESDFSDQARATPNADGGNAEVYWLTRTVGGVRDTFKLGEDAWGFANGECYPTDEPCPENENEAERVKVMWPEAWYDGRFDYSDFGYLGFLGVPPASTFPSWPLYSDVHVRDESMLPKWRETWRRASGEWKGSCLGFAVTAYLFFDQKMRLENMFPGADSLSEVDTPSTGDDNGARRLINRFWTSQLTYSYQEYKDQSGAKGPTEMLENLIASFESGTADHRALSFFNSCEDDTPDDSCQDTTYFDVPTGGHTVNPYKVVDGEDEARIYVYDNNHPSEPGIIHINKTANEGKGFWTYCLDGPDQCAPNQLWAGFDDMYLERSSSHFQQYAPGASTSRPALAMRNSSSSSSSSFVQVFAHPAHDLSLSTNDNEVISLESGRLVRNALSEGHPIVPLTGTPTSPVGYYVPEGNYEAELSNLSDENVGISFFSEDTVYRFEREESAASQSDRFAFESGALRVSNDDSESKTYQARTILRGQTVEKVFDLRELDVSSGEEAAINKMADDDLMLQNRGGGKDYSLQLQRASQGENVIVDYGNVNLAGNASHTLQPAWESISVNALTVEVDEDMDGTTDNTMRIAPDSVTINGDPVPVRPATLTRSISQSFGNTDEPQNYRLVALPGAGDTPVASTLDGEVGDDWRVFRDNGQSGSRGDYLVEYSDSDRFRFAPGRGFWMLSENTWQSSGEVETVSLSEDGSYTIDLHEGWNIVSNPFGTDVDWSTVQVANGVTQALWRWNGSYAEASIFASAQSGRAYYFFNEQGLDELALPYPTGDGNVSSPAAHMQDAEATPSALTLRTSTEGDSLTSRVAVGQAEGAKDGFDARDQYAPPDAFAPVQLHLAAPFGAESGHDRLAAEYRPADGEGQRFDVVLETGEASPLVMLSASGLDAFADQQVVLIDQRTLRRYDLHEQRAVRVQPQGETTDFALLLGSAAFVEQEAEQIAPEKSQLLGNYPNPFRTRTTIAYTVAEPSDVRLVLYDMLGRQVRTLVNEKQEPGREEVRLDARGLSSGVYVYRLKVGDYTETGKVVLVR